MVVRLHELMRDLAPGANPAVLPVENPDVTGLQHDSRRVEPGDLFVAITGEQFDGRAFANDAAGRGAVAVLGAGTAPDGLHVPWVEAGEPRGWMGPLAARLYDHPDERLTLVGITGTNGKSTVATLVRAMLEAAGRPSGILGTLGCEFRDLTLPPARTTPEATDFFRTLEMMRDRGAEAAVMEVSSHALELGRVAGAHYDVAVFTNLTRDHLDFHGDLESYFRAKQRLFEQLKPAGRSVVSVTDEWGQRLAAELDEPLTFGPGGDVSVEHAELGLEGTRATLATPRGKLSLRSALIGRYNLENLLAAVAAAEALELPHAAIRAAIDGQEPVSGRLEPIVAGQPFPVLLDYAHTPGAMEALLRSMAEITERRIIVVFGCGGDRDRGKRPLMGRIAGELAALPLATSDNPRTEDPLAILEAVEEGLVASGNANFVVEPDRRVAIRRAIEIATDGEDWAVLVAGKGHEGFQIIGGERIQFSDRKEVEKALASQGFAPTGGDHHG